MHGHPHPLIPKFVQSLQVVAQEHELTFDVNGFVVE